MHNFFEKAVLCFEANSPTVQQRSKATDEVGIVFYEMVFWPEFMVRNGLLEQLPMDFFSSK